VSRRRDTLSALDDAGVNHVVLRTSALLDDAEIPVAELDVLGVGADLLSGASHCDCVSVDVESLGWLKRVCMSWYWNECVLYRVKHENRSSHIYVPPGQQRPAYGDVSMKKSVVSDKERSSF